MFRESSRSATKSVRSCFLSVLSPNLIPVPSANIEGPLSPFHPYRRHSPPIRSLSTARSPSSTGARPPLPEHHHRLPSCDPMPSASSAAVPMHSSAAGASSPSQAPSSSPVPSPSAAAAAAPSYSSSSSKSRSDQPLSHDRQQVSYGDPLLSCSGEPSCDQVRDTSPGVARVKASSY